MAEAHLRIDEGLKRGPRQKHQHKPPAKRPDPKVGEIPPGLNPETVLERYLTESTTSQIALEFGVSRKTLVRWLVDQAPEQWKHVQIVRALCRKEDGDEQIEGACDALSLARAREMLKSGQWDLERLDSKNYGPSQQLTVKSEPLSDKDAGLLEDASELLRLFKSKLIEGQVVAPAALPEKPIESGDEKKDHS